MKTLYRFSDGKAYLAASPDELVQLIRQAADFEHADTDEAFMLRMAKRVLDEFGFNIPCDSAEEFVKGLMEAGLLEYGEQATEQE